jgi:hypothetical protein
MRVDPLPTEIVERREVHDGYAIIEVQSVNMFEPHRFLETNCVEPCKGAYRITEFNYTDSDPAAFYLKMRDALDRGDHSLISCYHNLQFGSIVRKN